MHLDVHEHISFKLGILIPIWMTFTCVQGHRQKKVKSSSDYFTECQLMLKKNMECYRNTLVWFKKNNLVQLAFEEEELLLSYKDVWCFQTFMTWLL